ncbi:MAG: hypothetical protein WDW36_005260 [Sanguina aurantia]
MRKKLSSLTSTVDRQSACRPLAACIFGVMSTEDDAVERGNNRLYLIGRLGRGVVTKEYAPGKWVGNTSLAVTQEGHSQSEWFNLAMFDSVAVQAEQQLVKGEMVAVSATLNYDRWPDKTNGPNESLKVVVLEIKKVGQPTAAEEAS